MTDTLRSTRPARAAIAAVLAFSATPLLAQTAEPVPIAPPTVAETVQAPAPAVAPPAVAAPAATPVPVVMAPAAPVVQQTASVEERRDAAIAQAEAEEAKAAPVARSANRAAPANRMPRQATGPVEAAPVSAREANPVTPAPAETAAVETQAVETVPPVDAMQSATAAQPMQLSNGNEALIWGLAGGALLVVGIAGTLAMRRRRMTDGEIAAEEGVTMHTSEGIVTVPETAIVQDPEAPVYAMATPVETASPVSKPAMAPDHQHGSVEAMVAAAPSAANPFLTRRNRLRRAQFLMEHQGQAMGLQTMVDQAVPATPKPVDRSQTVYSFGQQKGRRSGLIPRTQ